jgi:ubiquinone/menaquinone biosynthesis C-methylase UbiE
MVDFNDLDDATKARHLGNPEGEVGIAVAEVMNASNAKVHEAAFRRLAPRSGEQVLEIGFGNGKLLPGLLALAPGLLYIGLDISVTMVAEATRFNRGAVEAGQVAFILGACEDMPFEDRGFDRAVTVNTIYFWPEPVRCLAELHRVLRPDGILLLAAMDRETAARYTFTQHGFRYHDGAELVDLHRQAGFRAVSLEPYRETIPGPKGSTMERSFHFVVAQA